MTFTLLLLFYLLCPLTQQGWTIPLWPPAGLLGLDGQACAGAPVTDAEDELSDESDFDGEIPQPHWLTRSGATFFSETAIPSSRGVGLSYCSHPPPLYA